MSELTVSQIIKLILGLLVVVAVVAGAGLYFKQNIYGFFSGLSEDDNSSSGGAGEVDLSGYEAAKQDAVKAPLLLRDTDDSSNKL